MADKVLHMGTTTAKALSGAFLTLCDRWITEGVTWREYEIIGDIDLTYLRGIERCPDCRRLLEQRGAREPYTIKRETRLRIEGECHLCGCDLLGDGLELTIHYGVKSIPSKRRFVCLACMTALKVTQGWQPPEAG